MKIICSICIALYSLVSFSQSYHKLINTNKLWNFYDVYAGPSPHYTHLYRFGPDTLINSKIYSIVETSIDSMNWIRKNFYLREDDSTKSVYILYNNYEGLIYNFNFDIGDSITIYNTAQGAIPHLLTVSSIDSISIDGDYRNVFHFEQTWDTWIEGVGDPNGLEYPGTDITGFIMNLICFYENDSLKYINPEYGYCFHNYMAVPENIGENGISIYSTDNEHYYIEASSEIENITVCNITGQIIKYFEPKHNYLTLDISDFQRGILIIIVSAKSQQCIFKAIK